MVELIERPFMEGLLDVGSVLKNPTSELSNVRSIMSSGSCPMDLSRWMFCGNTTGVGRSSGVLCLTGFVVDRALIPWWRDESASGGIPEDLDQENGVP